MDLARSEKRRINREHMWSVLHDGKGRLGHAFNFGLILVILLSTAVVPLEFLPSYREYDEVIHVLEAVIVALFTVEYVLRVYSAPNRIRYVFSFFGIVDLLSIMPFYAGVFGTEYVRILRFIRFFKLAEMDAAAEKDEIATMQRDMGLMDGETVQYVVTKSPVTLVFGVLPSIIALTFGLGLIVNVEGYPALAVAIALFLFAFVFLWKTWLDFSYDVMYVTNYRLIFQNQHLLGRSINQVGYPAITNVKPYYPNPLSFICRYGSLVIDTAAEHPGQIGLHTIRQHEKAAQAIMQRCFQSKTPPVSGQMQA